MLSSEADVFNSLISAPLAFPLRIANLLQLLAIVHGITEARNPTVFRIKFSSQAIALFGYVLESLTICFAGYPKAIIFL